jgi:ABC-2 type transport system ATP-binding protein
MLIVVDNNAIVLQDVIKIYRTPSLLPWKKAKKTKALDGVSFTCPQGEITCLLGPNGAGKTTIIEIIAGLVTPDGGTVEIQDVRKRNIGCATPNDRSFYWRLTGRQNLNFFASLYGLTGRKRKIRVEEVLAEMGLTEEADKPFRLYSAGMKQKLILGRAILGEPRILLLDEPTTHIDPVTKKTIHDLIIQNFIKKRGATILLCTHDVLEAQALSDQLIILERGKVITKGSLDEIRKEMNPLLHVEIKCTRIPDIRWTDHLSLISFEQEDNRILCKVQDESEIPMILRSIIEHSGEVLNCNVRQDSLFDIIVRLTEGEKRC